MSVGSVGGAPSTGSYCTKLVIFTALCQTASSSLPSTRGGVSVRIGRMVGRPTSTPSDRACASSAAAPSGAARSDALREPSATDCEDSVRRTVGCAPAGDATDAIETVSTVGAATTVTFKFDGFEEVCALAEGRGRHQGSVTGWVSLRRAPAKIPCIRRPSRRPGHAQGDARRAPVASAAHPMRKQTPPIGVMAPNHRVPVIASR